MSQTPPPTGSEQSDVKAYLRVSYGGIADIKMVIARSTTREELLQELYDTPRFMKCVPKRYRLRMPEWTRIRCGGFFPRPPNRGEFLKKATIWGQFEKDSPLYLQLGGKIERLLPAVVGDHLAVAYSW